MSKLGVEFGKYVAARWLPFLVECVLRESEPLNELILAENSRLFDYRGTLAITELANKIAAGDPDGASMPTWRRMVTAWVNEGRAAEPDTIRRTLEALGADWVIGLGRSGYKRHAIAMLHTLWALGNRTRVSMQAKAIFSDSPSVSDDRASNVFRPRVVNGGELAVDTPHAAKLSKARKACWPRSSQIPTRATPPRDLPTSPKLYAAWMLLDAAHLARNGSLAQRLKGVDESVVREVRAWADEIIPIRQ